MTDRVIYVTGATGATGPQGPQGPKGDTGDPGASGSGFTHNQTVPASTWVITHNLHKYPTVQVMADDGSLMDTDIVHTSLESVTVYFDEPTTGKAVFS